MRRLSAKPWEGHSVSWTNDYPAFPDARCAADARWTAALRNKMPILFYLSISRSQWEKKYSPVGQGQVRNGRKKGPFEAWQTNAVNEMAQNADQWLLSSQRRGYVIMEIGFMGYWSTTRADQACHATQASKRERLREPLDYTRAKFRYRFRNRGYEIGYIYSFSLECQRGLKLKRALEWQKTKTECMLPFPSRTGFCSVS